MAGRRLTYSSKPKTNDSQNAYFLQYRVGQLLLFLEAELCLSCDILFVAEFHQPHRGNDDERCLPFSKQKLQKDQFSPTFVSKGCILVACCYNGSVRQ
jgi:hypothetical protein